MICKNSNRVESNKDKLEMIDTLSKAYQRIMSVGVDKSDEVSTTGKKILETIDRFVDDLEIKPSLSKDLMQSEKED